MIVADIDYSRILWAAFFTPMGMSKHKDYRDEIDWGQRLMLLGPPAAAKTATIHELAAKLSAEYYSFKPGVKGEGGIGAIPKPTLVTEGPYAGHEIIRYPYPEWVLVMNSLNFGIVGLDEFTTADNRMQGAMLGGVDEKEFGSTHLRGRVRVIGMGNEVIDTPGGWELAPANANRFCWIPWPDMHERDWGDRLMNDFKPIVPIKKVDAARIEATVMQAWPNAWSRNASMVRGYVRATGKLRDQPGEDSPQRSRAWMSQRSLRNMTCALAAADIHELSDAETFLMAAGYIGEGHAAEVMEFRRAMDLCDPTEWLDEKVDYLHDPMRMDRTYALVYAAAMVLVRSIPPATDKAGVAQHAKRTDRFWNYANTIVDQGMADPIADLASSVMMPAKLIPASAQPVIKKINPLLMATKGHKK